jgi:hypothetical protein
VHGAWSAAGDHLRDRRDADAGADEAEDRSVVVVVERELWLEPSAD